MKHLTFRRPRQVDGPPPPRTVADPEDLAGLRGCTFHCNGLEPNWAWTPERLQDEYGTTISELSARIGVVRFSINGLQDNLSEAVAAAVDWTFHGFLFSVTFGIHPERPVVGGVFEIDGVLELDPTICGLDRHQAYRPTPRGWQASGSFVEAVREVFDDMSMVCVAAPSLVGAPPASRTG